MTSGKFLEALGSGIGTGSIFCLSFSLSNRVGLYNACNIAIPVLNGVSSPGIQNWVIENLKCFNMRGDGPKINKFD